MFILLFQNPKILILDEATSGNLKKSMCYLSIFDIFLDSQYKIFLFLALDSVSEAAIQDSLQTISEDRTVLKIAHRLSTIRKLYAFHCIHLCRILLTNEFILIKFN